MRILLINNCHYRRGGADIVYFNTADLLEKNGHEVYFFSQQIENNIPYKYSDYFVEGINYREISNYQKIKKTGKYLYNTEAKNKLNEYIKLINPDIAHLHLFLGSLSVSILKALKDNQIPVVMSVHDYRLLCPANAFLDNNNAICEECIDKFYAQCTIKKCSDNSFSQSLILSIEAYIRKYYLNPLNYIDRFIFVSQFIKNKHIQFNSKYKSKAEMLYNFIPDIETAEVSTKKGNYFLFFGRISIEKGIKTLLESMQKNNLALKVVGTGPLLHEYTKKYASRNIEFLGYKKGQELEELIKKASFITVSSEWYENNPLTILEAYSYGKPAIGANIGGIPEIIVDGETGYLFKSASIENLQNVLIKANGISEDEYIKMSKNARIFAEKTFNQKQHYESLLAIYSKLV